MQVSARGKRLPPPILSRKPLQLASASRRAFVQILHFHYNCEGSFLKFVVSGIIGVFDKILCFTNLCRTSGRAQDRFNACEYDSVGRISYELRIFY